MTFIKNNYLSFFTAILLFLFLLTSCDDDPASADADNGSLEAAENPIAVIIEAQEQPMFGVTMSPEGRFITICYEDGECESQDSGGTSAGGEGHQRTVKASEPGRTVTGISVNVDVAEYNEGTGVVFMAEVDQEDDLRVDVGEEFFRSDVYGPGDQIVFELGEIDEE